MGVDCAEAVDVFADQPAYQPETRAGLQEYMIGGANTLLVTGGNLIVIQAANGITPEELSFTKNAIGQRDALQYETGIQKAAFIRRILDYNLPADYVEKQNRILAAMTKAEIDALAKKWLVADKMNILLVGDKAKILPGLQKSGYDLVELDVDGNKKDPHVK